MNIDDIKHYSKETRLYLIKRAIRVAVSQIDPALIGNEHLEKCVDCGSMNDDDGFFKHAKDCAVPVLELFINNPEGFLEDGGHNEAGITFLTPRE